MKVLVIIPCYNEEESILTTVKSLEKEKVDYVVIDDGSTDHSLQILKENHLNYIHLDNNLGIGGAIQTGYKYAKKYGYDIAIQMDGDGQHDASYISTLIEPIKKKKANLVIGSRFLEKDPNFKSTFFRRMGISILSTLYKWITGKKIKDMTSGFRAADKSVIELFAMEYPYEYPEPVTNLSIAHKNIVEVPVQMRKREHGKSSITPIKSMYYMLNVMIYFIIIIISRGDDYHA